MGERGPKPAPANLHLLRGNPSKKSIGALLDDVVRPPVAIPAVPAFLDVEARAEWQRLAPHLQSLGLVTELDLAMLAAYCVAWSEFGWACRRIEALNADDPTGEHGRIATAPSGYRQIGHLVAIRNRAMELCERFAKHFGLSPAERSRVTPSDPQLALEGIDAKPRAGGWGRFE